MFLHLSVSHSVHRWGVCLSACWDTHPPQGRYTPRQVHPPGQVHPSGRYTPRQVHPHDGHYNGRYASYWNTFLFLFGMTDDFKTMEYEEIYHIVAKNNGLTVNSAKHLKLLSGSFGGGGGSFKGIIECKFCCRDEMSAFLLPLSKLGFLCLSITQTGPQPCHLLESHI